MTLTLHLPPELEERLTQEAKRQGRPLDDYTLELLAKSLPPQNHRSELITLLQTWIEEEDAEEPRQAEPLLAFRGPPVGERLHHGEERRKAERDRDEEEVEKGR